MSKQNGNSTLEHQCDGDLCGPCQPLCSKCGGAESHRDDCALIAPDHDIVCSDCGDGKLGTLAEFAEWGWTKIDIEERSGLCALCGDKTEFGRAMSYRNL